MPVFAAKMAKTHFTKVGKSGKIKNVACWFTVGGGVEMKDRKNGRRRWMTEKRGGGWRCAAEGHAKPHPPHPQGVFGTFPIDRHPPAKNKTLYQS